MRKLYHILSDILFIDYEVGWKLIWSKEHFKLPSRINEKTKKKKSLKKNKRFLSANFDKVHESTLAISFQYWALQKYKLEDISSNLGLSGSRNS